MKLRLLILAVAITGCAQHVTVTRPAPALHKAQTSQWLKAVQEHAKAGDWFVIRGYKQTDNLVVAATNIPISHAGVYDPEKSQVIEATGKGVLATPLAKFVNKSHRLLIVRPKWWTEARGKVAARWSRKLVGKKYDFSGTIGAQEDDRWYCSEICFYAYRDHHIEKDHIPRMIEPGQMYLWGNILFDSGTRN